MHKINPQADLKNIRINRFYKEFMQHDSVANVVAEVLIDMAGKHPSKYHLLKPRFMESTRRIYNRIKEYDDKQALDTIMHFASKTIEIASSEKYNPVHYLDQMLPLGFMPIIESNEVNLPILKPHQIFESLIDGYLQKN